MIRRGLVTILFLLICAPIGSIIIYNRRMVKYYYGVLTLIFKPNSDLHIILSLKPIHHVNVCSSRNNRPYLQFSAIRSHYSCEMKFSSLFSTNQGITPMIIRNSQLPSSLSYLPNPLISQTTSVNLKYISVLRSHADLQTKSP